ncbi:MAG: reverse transcriptase family protein [Archangium sp.]|nr:reverse transcriptase family protein [Archangium sp.]MDP3569947.1 reverse transcriptase family protein [Archangium sp.]
MSFWDQVKRMFGGGGTAQQNLVRDAMLGRVARKERFTALDIANEVTANDPHRTADDLRLASDTVHRLFKDGLLLPLGYAQDAGGTFGPVSSPPLVVPPPNVVGVVGSGLSQEQRIRASIHARAAKKQPFNSMEIAAEITRTNSPDFMTVATLVGRLCTELLPGLGYSLVSGTWRFGVVAPPPAVTTQQRQQQSPPVRVAPPPPAAPLVLNSYQANPEILGLSADELRKRAVKINPYRTAWIGRVDTIPPQSDERTALIDRGLILRGLLTEVQIAEIHRVGDLWLRFHDADRLATAAAAKTADDAIEQIREAKRKKREERKQAAEAKELARVEGVAKRRAEDIIYLGRGVSRGLTDRRVDVESLQKLGLPLWSTPADVAKGLDLTIKQLRWLCFHAEATRKTHYVYFEIEKRSGGKRLLSAPHALLKATQRKVLDLVLEKIPLEAEAHGFVKGRSTVTNATPHVGQGVVLNVDLKNFFPTISYRRVRGLFQSFGFSPAVATVLGLLCTEAPRRKVSFEGAEWWVAVGERCLPQGAPTSPLIANAISRKLDRRLRGRLAKKGWVYTRYADDLSFSKKTFTRGELGFVHASIRHVVEDEGFALNPKKGRAQGRGGRQDVTGIVVNEKPGVPRDELKRLRAILHQAKKTGLEAQNRDKVPDYRRVLEGKIAYVMMVDRAKGQRLKAALDEVTG